MSSKPELIRQLRNMIGKEVEYNARPCIIVELLEEPLQLILEETGSRHAIQENQFGQPQRRAPSIHTLLCLEGDALHGDLLALGLSLD